MLSPFLFITKNKKKVGIVIIVLMLAVFVINFTQTAINSIYRSCYDANVKPYESYTILTSNSKKEIITQETIDRVNSNPEVKHVYEIINEIIPIKTVFGTTSSNVYLTRSGEECKAVLADLGLNVKEGRIPEDNSNEIAIHKSVAINKGLELNSSYEGFKIVGILEGDVQISVGSGSGLQDMFGTALMVLPYKSINELNISLRETVGDEMEQYNFNYANNNLEQEFNSINVILFLVIILISLSLAISVASLMHSVYSHRYDEFGILHAFGCSRSSIKRMVLLEILIIVGISWAVGYFASIVGLEIFDKTIYADLGQSIKIITPEGIRSTFLIPFFSLILTIIPVTIKLQKTDLISVIERRY